MKKAALLIMILSSLSGASASNKEETISNMKETSKVLKFILTLADDQVTILQTPGINANTRLSLEDILRNKKLIVNMKKEIDEKISNKIEEKEKNKIIRDAIILSVGLFVVVAGAFAVNEELLLRRKIKKRGLCNRHRIS